MSIPAPRLATPLPSFLPEAPAGWQFLLARAEAADRAGIDRVNVSDHVVFGERLDRYGDPKVGGTIGGKQPTGPDGQWLDPITVLTMIAARTTRVRLGTAILLAALRRPITLQKTLSTLDVLSGGRVDLGVGVGWQREEYDAAGLAFEERGRLLDHTLAVMQAVWRNEAAAFGDDYLSFEHIHSMPKPVQDGGVPIWVSGTANAAVARRIARFGSGWIPWGPAAADLVTGVPEMRDLVAAAGGSLDGMAIVGNLRSVRRDDGRVDYAATMEQVPELAAVGVTDFTLAFSVRDEAAVFDMYAEAVAAFRLAAGR
ncbi:MAG: TIGR03619 family F420-dependent LLM class oxidoreductase [Acidimicrobiia bacterium]